MEVGIHAESSGRGLSVGLKPDLRGVVGLIRDLVIRGVGWPPHRFAMPSYLSRKVMRPLVRS